MEAASPESAGAGAEAVKAAAGRAQPENRRTGPLRIGIPERQAKTPPGGSRLLRGARDSCRAIRPRPPRASGAAPLAGPGVSGAGVSGTSVFAVEGCPRALLRRLLAGAAGEADALAALGIEREILALCRERQEILAGLFEAEAALRELRTPPDVPAAAVPPPAQTGAVSVVPAPTRQVAPAPSPLRAALTAAGTADEADTGTEDTRVGDTRAGEPQPPRYALVLDRRRSGRAPRGHHRRIGNLVRARRRPASRRRQDRGDRRPPARGPCDGR